ncbi:MAG: DUF429 domain-containing protein [Anaerolineales bacterium]|nr:DUF429 domain-containing protein [Anaerolineales bacterium]
MLFDKTTFIGIDPTAGQKPFTYIALDGDLSILALGQGYADDILAFVGGQQSAYVAVNAPQQPNQGMMSAREVRQLLEPQPRSGRWNGFRVAEYELHSRGISIPRTPAQEENCARWVQMGFALFREIKKLGYQPFSPENAHSHMFLEVYPHGAFSALLERLPFPKQTLEGRIQRQLVLYLQKLRVSNPMQIFEEITRHRILQGILPLDGLYTSNELDALVAAYTAWLAATKPENVTLVGHFEEGQIALPTMALKSHYE